MLKQINQPTQCKEEIEENESSSNKSLPRLLKYCKDKSISKSFEASESNESSFGKEFKNTSFDPDSDHEYFSCENTGASSPSLQKRDLPHPNSFGILRSWSFHNLNERTSNSFRKS